MRHFTPRLTLNTSGVNVFNQDLSLCDSVRVNAYYVFPPFRIVSPLLRFLTSEGAIVAVADSKQPPLPAWWPLMNSMEQWKVLLAEQLLMNAILFPSKQGLKPGPLPCNLWAFCLGGVY